MGSVARDLITKNDIASNERLGGKNDVDGRQRCDTNAGERVDVGISMRNPTYGN